MNFHHRPITLTVLLMMAIMLSFTLPALAQTAEPPPGYGTSSSPYRIITLDNLYWITQTPSVWGDYFEQIDNIDADSTKYWDGGKGFTPIGNSSTNFTGNYDGLGHTISGLTINRSSSNHVGMFGYINSGSLQVDSLKLTSVSVTGVTITWVGWSGTATKHISPTVR